MEITKEAYENWLSLRDDIRDLNDGEGLCYCGHTFTCDCGNPTFEMFKESVERGTIILDDPKNGWRSVDDTPPQKAVGE